MEVINKDITLELLSIFGLLGSAWVISTTLGKNLFNYEYKFLDITIFKRIFKPRNKIKNIYQLIPILQKNTKKLFLLFSDLSTSLRSMNGIIINREIIENILSQEYYERKFIEIQTEVFNEFNVDFHDVYNSIKLFQNDDQVELYVNGVNRMYESLINNDYILCPGFEYPIITQDKLLLIIEKFIILQYYKFFYQPNNNKNNLLNNNKNNLLNNNLNNFNKISENLENMEIILDMENYIIKSIKKDMYIYYKEYIDIIICIKCNENELINDRNYKIKKLLLIKKIQKCFESNIIKKSIKKQLKFIGINIIIIFDLIINEEIFNKILSIINLYKENIINFYQFINLLNNFNNINFNENMEINPKNHNLEMDMEIDRVRENKFSTQLNIAAPKVVNGTKSVTVLGQADRSTVVPGSSTKDSSNSSKDIGAVGASTVTGSGTTNSTNSTTKVTSTNSTNNTLTTSNTTTGPSTVTEGKGANSMVMECTMGKGANSMGTKCTMGKGANSMGTKCTTGKGANSMGMECTSEKNSNTIAAVTNSRESDTNTITTGKGANGTKDTTIGPSTVTEENTTIEFAAPNLLTGPTGTRFESQSSTTDNTSTTDTSTVTSVDYSLTTNGITNTNGITDITDGTDGMDGITVGKDINIFWMFKNEFDEIEKIKEYPSIIIYKDDKIINIIPMV